MMERKLMFWLGEEAEAVWQDYTAKCEAEAEAMRHLAEADDAE